MHIKLYYYYTKDINISYLETKNNLAKNHINKFANKEILIPLNYLKFERPNCQSRQQKSYFTNNFIDKLADIFIIYQKCANFKFLLKLRHNKIISTLRNLFKRSDLREIEFLLANSILQLLRFEFKKYNDVSLFKSSFVYIKKKIIDKLYKKSYFVVQSYNNIEKTAFLT